MKDVDLENEALALREYSRRNYSPNGSAARRWLRSKGFAPADRKAILERSAALAREEVIRREERDPEIAARARGIIDVLERT